MTLPHPRTVRAKLTLFTMLVTGVLLALIVLIVDLSARRTLMASVDAELVRLSRRFTDRVRMGPPLPGGPNRPFPNGTVPRGSGGGEPARGGPAFRPPVRQADPTEVRPLFYPLDDSEAPPPPPPYDPISLSRAKAGEATFSQFTRGEETYRLYTFPVRNAGRTVALVQLPAPVTEVLRSLEGLRRTLLQVVLPLGVLMTGLASLLLVDRFMRPLRRISAEAERIGESDLSARLPVVGEDEFASLSTTLNGMLARLEIAFEKERSELQRQRQFTADASHELKTPLAIIKANAGLVTHIGGTPDEIKGWTREIDSAANRMTRLVNDMLLLARSEAGVHREHAVCDLREIVRTAIPQLGGDAARIQVETSGARVPVVASSDELARVVVNLAENALKHGGTDAPVHITVSREAHTARVMVRDRGKGIAPEHLPRLFDRFYRVEASRSSETGGTGLGLAICKSIVERHGGELTVESQEGHGSTFGIILPIADPASDPAP